MEVSHKKIKMGCVLVIVLAAAWNGLATAMALHLWFMPVPPDALKLDAADEIRLIGTILNGTLPIFLLCFLTGSVLAIRWKFPAVDLLVVSFLFVVSLAPGLVLWQELVRAHGPEINLWRVSAWWFVWG
ncbi:MAG: hypothetical protein JJU29_14015 [Verrucomicrobia bacterium]|nr:hypothetical protein [Verrucomicrobiota bacterium]MCH8512198.1 hypothetical protein [Kiritimatiellia bacterium]